MKRISEYSIFLSVLSAFSIQVSAELNQWQSIHPSGPENALGGTVREAAYSADNTAYIRSGLGNLYRRAAAENPWELMSPTKFGLQFTPSSLVFDPADPQLMTAIDVNYFSDGVGHIVQSTDGGDTWTIINDRPVLFERITELIASTTDQSTIYGRMFGGEFVKSTDGGANWTTTQVVEETYPRRVKVSNSSLDVLYAIGNLGTPIKSFNGGTTWTDAGSGLPSSSVGRPVEVAVAPDNFQKLYSVSSNSTIYRSLNAGASWDTVGTPESTPFNQSYTLEVHPTNSAIVYGAGSDGAANRTLDGGDTWQALAPTTVVGNFKDAAVAANGDVMLVGDSGVLMPKTTSTLEFSNQGFSDVSLDLAMFAPSDNSYLYAASYQTGIARTIGSDGQWELLNGAFNDLRVQGIAIDFQNPNVIWLKHFSDFYRSDDGGQSWVELDSDAPGFVRNFVIAPSNSNVMYIHSQPGFDAIYRSDNAGLNWQRQFGFDLGEGNGVLDILISPVNDQVVHIATHGNGLARTTDGGQSWQAIVAPFQTGDVQALVSDPHNPNGLYVGLSQGFIWHSSDDGLTWTDVTNSLSSANSLDSIAIDPFLEGRVYVTDHNANLSVYDPMDNNWSSLGAPQQGLECVRRCLPLIDNQRQGRIVVLANRQLYELLRDVDVDGVGDESDNCTLVENASQLDTNGDGFGNACDPDLNNDGVVNFSDLSMWVPFFNTVDSGDADFNGDGLVNFGDFALFSEYFLSAPGPSAHTP